MTHPPSSKKIPFGTTKLCQDFATLINNRQGSDIEFIVGGGRGDSTIQKNSVATPDESPTVTLYAHSLILRCRSRYFATMLDEDKNWKESSNGVIYKPNVSPSTFQDVLHYIYTGVIHAKGPESIIELIIAAEEMDLDELSTECQAELIRIVKSIFHDEDNVDDKSGTNGTLKNSTYPRVSIDVATRTHIIPALNLASSHSLSNLSQKLQAIVLPHMSVIINSPDAYTALINKISLESISKVIASDYLEIPERSVWDLALSWGCHQTKLSKVAVEKRLSSAVDDEDNEKESSELSVSLSQLNLLKENLEPLLPSIRFSLLDPEDHPHMIHPLSYFLSRRRFSELALIFVRPNGAKLPDTPRNDVDQKIFSKIILDSTSRKFLIKTILETGGITGCRFLKHLKFELLFRASEHGFLAKTFHQHCDNKGPTLIFVRSTNGHLFGGVNFNHWKSDNTYSSSSLNFLFALPDKRFRKSSEIFRIKDNAHAKSSYNYASHGPIFGGGHDLFIANAANNNISSSSVLDTYDGKGASVGVLAGAREFMVSDYEVFAISKQ